MVATFHRKQDIGVRRVLTYLVLLIGAAISLFPFYWLVSGSLKPASELFRWPPTFIPSVITLDAYRYLWQTMDVPRVMLHARSLGFRHPVTGEMCEFERPSPPDMERFLSDLNERLQLTRRHDA